MDDSQVTSTDMSCKAAICNDDLGLKWIIRSVQAGWCTWNATAGADIERKTSRCITPGGCKRNPTSLFFSVLCAASVVWQCRGTEEGSTG